LGPGDALEDFSCRSAEQTTWLREHARQAHAARSAHVMIATEAESGRVAAYYAWAMASVSSNDLSARAARGVGRHPQPFALLARLAVATEHEGRGLGHGMLVDAIVRTVEVSTRIGCRGLLVHAENEVARSFYLHALPGFEQSPSDPMHLLILVKDLRRAIAQR